MIPISCDVKHSQDCVERSVRGVGSTAQRELAERREEHSDGNIGDDLVAGPEDDGPPKDKCVAQQELQSSVNRG